MSLSSAERYVIALSDPFNPEAVGAQVPDEYSFPTVPVTISQTFNVQQWATGNYTNGDQSAVDFVCHPSPFRSVACQNSDAATGMRTIDPGYGLLSDTALTGLFNSVQNLAAGTPGVGVAEMGVVNPPDLATQYEQYRVIGFGYRYRDNLNDQIRTGRISIGATASTEYAFPAELYGSGVTNTAWGEYRTFYSFPSDVIGQTGFGILPSELSRLPEFEQATLDRVAANGGIEWVGKMCGATSHNWRDTVNDNLFSSGQSIAGNGQRMGLSITNNASTSVEFAGAWLPVEPCYCQQGGWSSFCVKIEGLPEYTGGANTSRVIGFLEVIYHLEAIPNILPNFGAKAIKGPVVPGLVQHAAAHANSLPTIRRIANRAVSSYEHVDAVVKRFSGQNIAGWARSLL